MMYNWKPRKRAGRGARDENTRSRPSCASGNSAHAFENRLAVPAAGRVQGAYGVDRALAELSRRPKPLRVGRRGGCPVRPRDGPARHLDSGLGRSDGAHAPGRPRILDRGLGVTRRAAPRRLGPRPCGQPRVRHTRGASAPPAGPKATGPVVFLQAEPCEYRTCPSRLRGSPGTAPARPIRPDASSARGPRRLDPGDAERAGRDGRHEPGRLSPRLVRPYRGGHRADRILQGLDRGPCRARRRRGRLLSAAAHGMAQNPPNTLARAIRTMRAIIGTMTATAKMSR